MQNRTELENRIDALATQQFMLNMKDRWSPEDFNADRKMSNEIRELKQQLAQMEAAADPSKVCSEISA